MLNEGTSAGATRKLVYTVTEKGDKTFWTRIGAAFQNRDGSINVRLEAVPVNGMLQIRDEEPARRGQAGGAV
jgi:hypothetical protein